MAETPTGLYANGKIHRHLKSMFLPVKTFGLTPKTI